MNTITKKQKEVLDFIEKFIEKKDYPPTLEEIKNGLGLSAVSTVHQHIKTLVEKNFLKKEENFARAIEINDEPFEDNNFIEIPLLGFISAGAPIETLENPELIKVPKEFVTRGNKHFALKVQGHSMQEADIFNGDIVVIREQSQVENGAIGVAVVEGKATLKKIYKEKNLFRLQPANKDYEPIFVRELEVKGKLTGVVRNRYEIVNGTNFFPLAKVSEASKKKINIQSRRFLGNKSKLLGFISDIIAEKCPNYESFCDIFAGTGVVGHHFAGTGIKVISNDILDSNYVSLQCWLGTKDLDVNKLNSLIDRLNDINPSKENYASINFGGTYFTKNNAKKIGAIREAIEMLETSEEEKYILLTSLVYAMDKVANTVGHYETYRKTLDTLNEIKLLVPDINVQNNQRNEIYKEDANNLIRQIECDILYIDPPYNSRQYGDAYHLLENITTWNKPSVEGVAKKMVDRAHIKSKYCLKSAPEAFRDLIINAKAKHILLSYNNTAEKKNGRSNATISDKHIIDTLKLRGKVEIFERDYKGFTTGKSDASGNSERVFYCKVTK